MSNVDDYTIVWISTVYTDYTAAQAFLDEKHPALLSPRKRFDFTLGRIGGHNVVLLLSQLGQRDGMSLEAFMKKEMLHDFPNIRIGLMVGTGSGAPSEKHDIRLGDIVVRIPRNGERGVLQYDFDKTIRTQRFQPIGGVDHPPAALRAAMGEIKAQYKNEGHNLDDKVHMVLEMNPELQEVYQRPDIASDRLYRSHITHSPYNGPSCASSCGEDPSSLVMRPPRFGHDENPAIHYGLIASAHQPMYNASIRDKLAEQADILCFETEAAGLMNECPFLLIRGICDYADLHDNQVWQGYAAMVAAAYAKDLVSRIPTAMVEQEAKMINVLNEHRHLGPIFLGTNNSGMQAEMSKYSNTASYTSGGLGERWGNGAFYVSTSTPGRPPVPGGPPQGSSR